MRKIGILGTIILCVVLIISGVFYLTQPQKKDAAVKVKDKKVEEADWKKASKLMSEGDVEESLKIIHQYEDEISMRTEFGRRWLDLLVLASVKTNNIGQLMILYEAYPKIFDEDEQASILVANGYITAKRPLDYNELRQKWVGRETLDETWFVLDADALLLEGKKEGAMKFLKANKLQGRKDIDRLVRLALLNLGDNPKVSWDYLAEAYSLDPTNADVITYRGRLLESLGKDSLALYEYLAAIQADPKNLFLRDQLAEFYMRRNQAGMALSVWLETLSRPSLDLIWIKSLFWSKVILPMDFNWKDASSVKGVDKEFIDYLIALPGDVFWDVKAFENLSKAKTYLSTLQVTFWLRLLQALKDDNEKEAWNLMQFNKFSDNSLNPLLEKALKQILNYRLSGTLHEDIAPQPNPADQGAIQENLSFFNELTSFASREDPDPSKIPQSLQDFLKSKEIFAAAFLEAGWTEAGLMLLHQSVIPPSLPDWVAYKTTQGLQANRSVDEAIAFAINQKKTAELSLLIGELYIAANQPEKALQVLLPYTADPSEIGYRASWLVSVIYVDREDFDNARKMITLQPKLAEDIQGKEALARIALQQGDEDLADRLYSQIQESSPEAMSYLARKAYAEKKWSRARELTEHLLLMFPDSPILRENLNKILEEQKSESAHEEK